MENTPDNFALINQKGLRIGDKAYRLNHYARNSGKRKETPFRTPVVITGFTKTGRVQVKRVEYMGETTFEEPRVSRWARPRNASRAVLPSLIEKR